MTPRDPEPAIDGLSSTAAGDVQTVAKGGAVQIVGQVVSRNLGFFFQLAANRILGVGLYGVYRWLSQVLAVAGQLGLAGFNYASMRFIAQARARSDHGGVRGAARIGLSGAGLASAIVVLVLLVGADPIASTFKDNKFVTDSDIARFLRIGAAYVPLFALMQVLRYCTQAYKTMVPSVMAGNVIQPTARFLLGVAFLAAGFDVAGAVTSLMLSMAVGAGAAAWYLSRMLTSEERAATPSGRPGPMVRFALPQAGASLLGIQSLGLGLIVLGIASGAREVGLFGIALALQGPGTVFLGGIVNIWAPVVSELHAAGEIERLDSLYKTINRWIATFSFPVFAALMLEGDLFVDIFAGDKGADAVSVVAILAAGNIFYTGTGPTGYVISMTGRPGVNFLNSIVAVALYIGLGAAIVPDHGAVGMAAIDAGVTAFINTVRVVEAKILVGVQPFGRSFLKPVAATLVGIAVLLLWRLIPGDSMPLAIAGLVVAGGVYFLILKLLGLDPEERHVIDRVKRRTLRRGGGA